MMARIFSNEYMLLFRAYDKIQYDVQRGIRQPSVAEYERLLNQLRELYRFIKSAPDFMESNEIVENLVSGLNNSIVKSIRELEPNYGILKIG